MTTRIDICTARLTGEEGLRLQPYNDATSKRVTCKPEGNLTIGVGINLEYGIDLEECTWLTFRRVVKADKSLQAYDWYSSMDEPRGSVFLDIGFNVGIAGLLHFTTTIHYASEKNWSRCAQALMQSKAAQELPARYKRFEQIILSGEA